MSGILNKTEKYYRDLLELNENTIHGIRARADWYVSAQLKGAVAGATAGAVTGALGGTASIGSIGNLRKPEEGKSGESIEFPLTGQMTLILTDSRIIVLERGLLFGFVKGVKGYVYLNRIKNVKMTNEKGLGDLITIDLNSYSVKFFGRRSDGTTEFVLALKKKISQYS